MTAFVRDEAVALVLAPGAGAALVSANATVHLDATDAIATIADIEHRVSPRWVWWDRATPDTLVAAGITPVRCWDLDAVHRLLHGGWRAGPARSWAAVHDLDTAELPTRRPLDLFSAADPDDPDDPVRADGHLQPEWIDGTWAATTATRERWARLALEVHDRQAAALDALALGRPAIRATVRAESATEVLCAELEHEGLPVDVAEAERIIATFIGPRPRDDAHAARLATERDEAVLQHLHGPRDGIDLRNPASVRSLLRRAGIEVDDTRAHRLEQLRDAHPIVDALLRWRKAERIATTFGYRWLDEHVGDDGRLRGRWSGCDGAAGRMTATAGLHNLPAELRPAIAAAPGHRLVRADLGQIEPRVLAAVSGDAALAAATDDSDLYAPVAARLGVPRDVAKLAVLGAMYGQTTGHGAAARAGLEAAFSQAMTFLADAAIDAANGHDLRTRGGRLVRMSQPSALPDAAGARAAQGRYGRNAMIQGAAAEFFKTWALVVRQRLRGLDAAIVLCLHDELLVHVTDADAHATATAVNAGLDEAAHRWLAQAPGPAVRFVADTSVISRWSDATA